jgi:hypothetical protein
MTSHNLTVATNHYRSRRYDQAAYIFDECEKEPHEIDDSFSNLPNLAIQADAALCRFRSSSSPQNKSKYSSNEQMDLLKRAREAYRVYLSALEEVVCQLNRNIESGSNIRHGDLIDEKRVQTSMAILMTLVTIFWLDLSVLPDETDVMNRSRAIATVRNGIQMAACCFLSHSPRVFMPTWIEGMGILERINHHLKDTNWKEEEVTRMQFALKSIYQVLSISDLNSGVESDSVLDDNDLQNTDQDNSETLYFQRQLVKILRLYNYHYDNVEKRSYMHNIGEEIMTKCDNVQIRKICILVLVNDALRNSGNMTLDSAIDALKPFVFSSATAAYLMSSLYIKKNEYHIALEYLYKSLSTTKSCSQHYLDIVSNIASCFGKLGEPHPVVELLLHWISTHDAKNIEKSTPMEYVSFCLDMNERNTSIANKYSVLWRLLYASELVGDIDTSRAVVHVLSNDR